MANSHVSKLAYVGEHPDALAVYCSDGRFTGAIAELLASNGYDRLDTLTIPGGPALFETASSSLIAVDATRKSASFLIRAHKIKHVMLLAHRGCGYYKAEFFHEQAEVLEARQLADLRSSAGWVRASHAGIEVVAYFARPEDGHVIFDPIDC
jgi:carbonic anhydrase